jgi:hypothetical protein
VEIFSVLLPIETMLSFLRHIPGFQQRLALGIAFVLLFFGTVGELAHSKHHQGRTSSAASETMTISALPTHGNTSCPLCEWESSLVSGPAPIVLPLLLLVAALFSYFLSTPLFSVRQILALRESRGPPCLA